MDLNGSRGSPAHSLGASGSERNSPAAPVQSSFRNRMVTLASEYEAVQEMLTTVSMSYDALWKQSNELKGVAFSVLPDEVSNGNADCHYSQRLKPIKVDLPLPPPPPLVAVVAPDLPPPPNCMDFYAQLVHEGHAVSPTCQRVSLTGAHMRERCSLSSKRGSRFSADSHESEGELACFRSRVTVFAEGKTVESPPAEWADVAWRRMTKAVLLTQEMKEWMLEKELDADANPPSVRLFGNVTLHEQSLDESQYDVTMYYKNVGLAQNLARSNFFGNISIFVILLNAAYLGISAEIYEESVEFIVADQLFCIFFVWELMTRFCAFQRKRNCFKDRWFKFDLFLVSTMVAETWFLTLLMLVTGIESVPLEPMKLLRLLRLARMTRLLRLLPELLTMVMGMRAASRAVGSSLLMLLLLIYVFSIAMSAVVNESQPRSMELVGSMPLCMWNLFMAGTGLGGSYFMLIAFIDEVAVMPVMIFLTYILFSSMTVMNMLIGILCNVVQKIEMAEKDQAAVQKLKLTLLVMLKELDSDQSGNLDKYEVKHVFDHPRVLQTLESLNVDIEPMLCMLEMVFETSEKGTIAIGVIMDLILRLRGDRPVTVQDMIDRHSYTMWTLSKAFEEFSDVIIDRLAVSANGRRGSPSGFSWAPASQLNSKGLAAVAIV